jgi:hypothetical protein
MAFKFFSSWFGKFRSNKKNEKLKKAFAIIVTKRKKLDELWENGDYDMYLSVLNECIDEFDSLSYDAQGFKPLYKGILSEISMLKFHRDVALVEINRIQLQRKNQADGTLMILHRKSKN